MLNVCFPRNVGCTPKCTSGSSGSSDVMMFVTAINGDIRSSCKGLEVLNGKVIDVVQKSEKVYNVKFKNGRIYKLKEYP